MRSPLPPIFELVPDRAAPHPARRPGDGPVAPPPDATAEPVETTAPAEMPVPKARPGLAASALIGIFSLSTGRTALLMLPGGEVRQLAIGDTIDGWRVSAISQTALRVTRGGQTRTFPLVGN